MSPIAELSIELTTRCPLRCRHCSTAAGPEGECDLPPAEAVRLVEEAALLGVKRLSLSGGEPMCYPYLPEVLAAAGERGLSCTVYTCGVGAGHAPLEPEFLRWLRERGVSRIVFNLNGADSETHDFITQAPGSMETALVSIERAAAAGLATEIHAVPMKPNLGQLADIVRLGRALDAVRVSFLRAVPQGRFLLHRGELELDAEEWRRLRGRLLEALEAGAPGAVRLGAPFNCMLIGPPVSCAAGIDGVLVTPRGTVLPCEAFKHCEDGAASVLGRSLREAWVTDELLNCARFFRRNPGSCEGCGLYERCRGGCLGQRALAGGMDSADPRCPARLLAGEILPGGRSECASAAS